MRDDLNLVPRQVQLVINTRVLMGGGDQGEEEERRRRRRKGGDLTGEGQLLEFLETFRVRPEAGYPLEGKDQTKSAQYHPPPW